MNELISIICTVKNGERTISKTIDSVLQQNYQRWEFILIDDGSTDNTVSILKEYESIDKRIKVTTTEGVGRGKALNMAINLSKGMYIANIDADDLMHPQRLEIQLQIIKSKPVFLVSTDCKLIYGDQTPEWSSINQSVIILEEITQNILFRNQINHSSVLVNKMMLLDIGGYDDKRKSQFDYELWLRAFTQGMEMVKIKSTLTAKRIHSNQSFENKKRLNYTFNSMILQLQYIFINKKYLYLSIVLMSFVLSLLPFKVRRFITSKIIKIN